MERIAGRIEPGMEVVYACGAHAGTVGRVAGDQIELAEDPASSGRPTRVATAQVASVDTKVHLSHTASERPLAAKPS